jgi:hypothetical protein
MLPLRSSRGRACQRACARRPRGGEAPRSSKPDGRTIVAKGRTRGDAPEIDGAVHVTSRRPLRLGEIATVRIERADQYDLHGTVVGF